MTWLDPLYSHTRRDAKRSRPWGVAYTVWACTLRSGMTLTVLALIAAAAGGGAMFAEGRGSSPRLMRAAMESSVPRWVRVSALEKPYATPHGRESARFDLCSRSDAWRYSWSSGKERGVRPLASSDELCNLTRGRRVLQIGDSLSGQFITSWCNRLGRKGVRANVLGRPHYHVTGAMCSCPGKSGGSIVHYEAYNWVLCEGDDCGFSPGHPAVVACAPTVAPTVARFTPSALLKHIARSNATDVVWNDFSHMNNLWLQMRSCYRKRLVQVYAHHADDLAWSDLLRFWARRTARLAHTLQRSGLRNFYRTSPAAADVWLRGERSVPDARVPIPLGQVQLAAHNDSEYSHGLYMPINHISIAAFEAAGHHVIHTDAMLTSRIDAHPASIAPNRTGDALHFCMPGPVDFALDSVLRAIDWHGSSVREDP